MIDQDTIESFENKGMFVDLLRRLFSFFQRQNNVCLGIRISIKFECMGINPQWSLFERYEREENVVMNNQCSNQCE